MLTKALEYACWTVAIAIHRFVAWRAGKLLLAAYGTPAESRVKELYIEATRGLYEAYHQRERVYPTPPAAAPRP